MPVKEKKNQKLRDLALRLFNKPLLALLFEAQTVHRENHPPDKVQRSALLSIKTGACSEDCGYCAQSARWDTDLKPEPLMPLAEILENARAAKGKGATRFCMGAAWKQINDKDMPQLEAAVKGVKDLGMETCVTLGGCSLEQAKQLKRAGLDYYNHNLDSSREFYPDIITTRSYDDRLQTLKNVKDAGLHTCSGGILGMGESREDRAGLIAELAALDPPPDSVPINQLMPIKGTPLEHVKPLDKFEFVRTIAVARLMMPKSVVRLSAGREAMSEELQALCFLAGANSIFYGEKLLTTGNPDIDADQKLFEKLGISPMDPGEDKSS